jgi:hypothetical protein
MPRGDVRLLSGAWRAAGLLALVLAAEPGAAEAPPPPEPRAGAEPLSIVFVLTDGHRSDAPTSRPRRPFPSP